jgi:hypothetical protein
MRSRALQLAGVERLFDGHERRAEAAQAELIRDERRYEHDAGAEPQQRRDGTGTERGREQRDHRHRDADQPERRDDGMSARRDRSQHT